MTTPRLLLLIAALSLPWLGLAPLFDVDEGAFSEATREMFASGDFLSTTLNGAPRFDKPILIYWLQAAAVGAFGLNEFALRLPSALATLGWCAAVLQFAAPRIGVDRARLAAWIGATSLGVVIVGRAATADALLNALLAAALLDAWRHFDTGDRAALRRMYGWIGLGVLTKGPIAVLIPLAVTLLWCASYRQWRPWWRALTDPVGWLIGSAIAAPWYLYALAVHGRGFIDGFIMKHNVERFSGTLEGHSGSALYYVVAVPLLLVPWTALFGRVLAGVRQDWQGRMTRFLWLWFLFVLVFFSASGTKLPHYALYGITPLFVLLAMRCDPPGISSTSGAVGLFVPTLMLLALPAAPWLLGRVAASLSDPRTAYHAAMGLRALQATPPWYYAVTVGAAVGWLAWLAATRRADRRNLAIGAGLVAFVMGAATAPWLGEVLQGPLVRAARVVVQRGEPVVAWDIFAPGFSVYTGQAVPSREPRPGELALARIDRLPAGADVEVVFREGGVLLVRRR